MDFSNVLRHFGDVVKLDPSIPLANKLNDIVKDQEIEVHDLWKILRYIHASKSPRIY